MNRNASSETRRRLDPRWFQIGSLTFLLSYGLFWLRFDLQWEQTALTLLAVCLMQVLLSSLFSLPRIDLKSACISGLSLCLLLRTNEWWVAVIGAFIAISSKFLLRVQGRHLFNPTNFALIVLIGLAPEHAWVSPAQWGNFAFFAFLMLCLGGLVVNRASRSDVTIAFLIFYVAIVFGRSTWLNEPWAIPLHKLQNGALLLFAFFMISDPKTTPDSRAGRIIFALLVALGAAYVQFKLFRNNGLLWSLALFTLSVPILNWIFPGAKYEWNSREKLQPQISEKIQPAKLIYETATH